MSEALRVALVAEGPTDRIAIGTILSAVWGVEVPFICTLIQPERREAELGGSADASQAVAYGATGGGWGGVYRWCRSIAAKGTGEVLQVGELQYDMLIMQLDVDVARKNYSDANITEPIGLPLPCARPCPPASNSANALQAVVNSWLAPVTTEQLVWCFPADNLETWLFAGSGRRLPAGATHIECRHDIAGRIPKRPAAYHRQSATLRENWPEVEAHCPQAKAFSDALRNVRSLLEI